MSNTSTTGRQQAEKHHSVLVVAAGAVGATAVVLLAAGCILSHNALLAMGVVASVIAVGLACVVGVQHLIDRAVDRALAAAAATLDERIEDAIAATATKVGLAIADGLRDAEVPDPIDDRWLGDGDGPPVKPIPIYT